MKLVFDIETKASPDAGEFVSVQAPGNYKDPEKIREYIAEKKLEATEKAALDPDLGEIVAIGVSMDGDIQVMMGEEATFLKEFWNLWSKSDLQIGYNIINFDIPYLLRRSMAHKVPAPSIALSKYKVGPVYDLMNILYPQSPKGLKWVCKRYGIPNILPDLDGSQVKDMDDETIARYVANDVRMTEELMKLMNGVYFNIFR